MHKEGLLPDGMWGNRIKKGVIFNLRRYPLLNPGFKHFKKDSAFDHPKDFPGLIDSLICEEANR